MGFFKRPTPAWAQELLLQMRQLNQQLGKILSEDAAIEAQVAILVSDQAALASAFATLEAEVAAGTPPSPQTLADLTAAVSAITGTIPPAPTPPAPTP
jgi:hypothetical protein